MRDLDAVLASLINIDRGSLIAILSSEAEAAERLAQSTRQRTTSQRSKRRDAAERAAMSLFANLLKINCVQANRSQLGKARKGSGSISPARCKFSTLMRLSCLRPVVGPAIIH
jgi:hypothetical protein